MVVVSHDAVNTQLLSLLDPTLGRPHQIRQRTAGFNERHYDEQSGWAVLLVDELPLLAKALGGLTTGLPGRCQQRLIRSPTASTSCSCRTA